MPRRPRTRARSSSPTGTAARLGPGATRPREDGALAPAPARRAASRAGSPTAPAVIDVARLQTLFPRTLGEYLDPGPPEPEHRLAAIGFIRFAGTDRLLADEGPDTVARATARGVTRLEECLATEGVTLLSTDLDSDGGRFFLGLRRARTRARTTRAACCAPSSASSTSDLPLAVQAGCNRGHVFVAELGRRPERAFSAMGDTTNTAARIMSKAPPGLLYAHPAVLEHSRTLFATEPAGPFAMKGKAVPLLVYAVGEESGTREPGEGGRPAAARPRRRARRSCARSSPTALQRRGCASSRSPARRAWARPASCARRPRRSRASPRLTVRAEPYGAASSYRVFRDPLRLLLGIERGDARRRWAQQLLAVAGRLRTRPAADVTAASPTWRRSRCRRPPRRTRSTRSSAPTGWPTCSSTSSAASCPGDPADRARRPTGPTPPRPTCSSASPPPRVAGPGRWSPSAGATDGRLRPDAGHRRSTLGPLPARRHGATRDRGDRGRAAASARGRRRSSSAPRATRCSSRRSPASPAAAGTLGTMPDSLQAAMAAQIDLLDPTARRVLRTAAVLGRSFRARGAARDPQRRRPGARPPAGSPQPSRVPRRRRPRPAPLPQQPGARRRLRGARLQDARPPAPGRRAGHGAAQRRPRRRRPHARRCTSRAPATTSARGATRGRPGRRRARAYANADAAAQYELALDVSRRVPRRHRRRSAPARGRCWASCASWPGCSTARSRPMAARPR